MGDTFNQTLAWTLMDFGGGVIGRQSGLDDSIGVGLVTWLVGLCKVEGDLH